MKARQNRNGQWTISGITSEEIVAISEMIQFGNYCNNQYGYGIVEMQKKIDDLRNRGVWGMCSRVEFLLRCISDQIKG